MSSGPPPKDDCARLAPWLQDMYWACREAGEDLALLAAICLRETLGGWAPGYHPRGSSAGTGDEVPRSYTQARIAALAPVRVMGLRQVPVLDRDGEQVGTVTRQAVLPAVGGWGAGLFQIDRAGPYRKRIPADLSTWTVDAQARVACTVLADARRELAAYATHPHFERACVAAYNAGSPAVTRCLRAGRDPDICTTGLDYSTDVLRRRDNLRAVAPYTFAAVERRFPPGPGAA